MDSRSEHNEASSSNNSENLKCLGKEKTELQEGAIIEEKMSAENSDYDSADSYSDEEQNIKIRSKASDLDDHSHSDTGSVILERQEGDGQESVPSKKVDDDEDKKNPQYIPKKGTFYEHDDRTVDDDEENENEADKEKDNKKKVWQDKKEKWSHDKFNDMDQAPKSKAELVAIYGYDIRNEEGPPRARRRRRYGRGPNKYTRTWEDEAAYVKAVPTNIRTKKQRGPHSKNTEEFPPLVKSTEKRQIIDNNSLNDDQGSNDNQFSYDNQSSNENRSSTENGSPIENKRQDHNHNRKSLERTEPVTENIRDNGIAPSQEFSDKRIHPNTSTSKDTREPQNSKNPSQRTNSGRVVKPRKEIKDSDHRGFTTKTRQLRPIKNEQQKILPPRNQQPKVETPSKTHDSENKNNAIQDIEKEMNKLSVNGAYKGSKYNIQQNNQQRQASVPPRLQNEQKGSKRYSSMRQRSLPEANTPPAVPTYQHTGYYPNEYNQQPDPAVAPQPLIHQATPIHHTTTQVSQLPPQTIPIPQQVPPVTAAPLLQAQFPQGFPQAPPTAFLQPGVPPPTFIPPQPPQIINYVQGQPTFPPNFQGYQQQFNPVHELLYSSNTHFSPSITTEQLQTPQTELYQPQGGITYYSTDQQIAQRPVPQKRPKAAIPIVAPPSDDRKTLLMEQHTMEDRNDFSESAEVQQ